MLKKLFILKLLLNFFIFPCFGKTLSLNKFIELAEKNDPNFDYILADKERTKFLVDLGLPTQALLLSVRTEYGIDSDNDQTNVAAAEISKDFLETGTRVSIARSEANRPDREEKLTELRLEQSIYRNLLGRDTRLQKESLELEVSKTKLQIIDIYEDYIKEISDMYFNYGEAYINYRLSLQIYNESKNLNQNVKERFSQSVADQIDIDRANLQLIIAEEDMLNKKMNLDASLLELKRVTTHDFTLSKPEVKPLLDYTEELPRNKSELRALEILLLDQKIARNNLTLQDRGLDPEINLILGYNIDNSNRFNTQVDRSESVFGVEATLPIGDSSQKAQKMAALLEKNKVEISLKDERSKVTSGLLALEEKVKVSKSIMKIAQKKIDLAQKVLSSEEERYKVGRVDLEQVIEAKNNYAAYRFEFYSKLIEYNKYIVEWLSLTDQLISKKIFE